LVKNFKSKFIETLKERQVNELNCKLHSYKKGLQEMVHKIIHLVFGYSFLTKRIYFEYFDKDFKYEICDPLFIQETPIYSLNDE
jgi:hypothetical protein